MIINDTARRAALAHWLREYRRATAAEAAWRAEALAAQAEADRLRALIREADRR